MASTPAAPPQPAVQPPAPLTQCSNYQIILQRARRFFESNPAYIKILHNINVGRSTLSLRLIDWFLTNYTREHETYLDAGDYRDKGVYNMYRNKLRKYNKKYFDTFCRGDRIVLPQPDDQPLETTIGQLNLFCWLFQEGILDVILRLRDQIQEHMAANSRRAVSLPALRGLADGRQKKRREITKSSSTMSVRRRVRPLGALAELRRPQDPQALLAATTAPNSPPASPECGSPV